jgi:hypothetical protein
MKRICYHYKHWEDWKSGLYNIGDFDLRLIEQSVSILSSTAKFYEQANLLLESWPISSDQNLSDTSRNRRAWVGQAACCINRGVPENLTRIAWHKLSKTEQDKANKVADRIIDRWEENYRKKTSCQRNFWE